MNEDSLFLQRYPRYDTPIENYSPVEQQDPFFDTTSRERHTYDRAFCSCISFPYSQELTLVRRERDCCSSPENTTSIKRENSWSTKLRRDENHSNEPPLLLPMTTSSSGITTSCVEDEKDEKPSIVEEKERFISGLSTKRTRTAFTPVQLLVLETAFEKNHYVVGYERKQLAAYLKLSETQVKVWFQNRRTKWKKTTQMPCGQMWRT